MSVVGVRVRVAGSDAPDGADRSDHDVLVVLSERSPDRGRPGLSLPIVIGPHEGVAIATAQAGVRSPRPGPHDLLLASLDAAGARLEHVTICALREGTFIAELVLSNGGRVDSRASDAITLALRAEVDVWCAQEVLDVAGVLTPGEHADEDEIGLSDAEEPIRQAVAQFRQFLDAVEPEDFDERRGRG